MSTSLNVSYVQSLIFFVSSKWPWLTIINIQVLTARVSINYNVFARCVNRVTDGLIYSCRHYTQAGAVQSQLYLAHCVEPCRRVDARGVEAERPAAAPRHRQRHHARLVALPRAAQRATGNIALQLPRLHHRRTRRLQW